MRNLAATACFLLAWSSVGQSTTAFIPSAGSDTFRHFRTGAGTVRRAEAGVNALAMATEPPRSITRGEAIASAAAGLLTSLAGVSLSGAAAPESLPSCPPDGNCVSSTSFKLVMQGRYLAPWYYADDNTDPKAAFAKLEDAVEKDPNLKTVEKDPDSFYLRAMARSAVPPDGFDRVEFLLKWFIGQPVLFGHCSQRPFVVTVAAGAARGQSFAVAFSSLLSSRAGGGHHLLIAHAVAPEICLEGPADGLVTFRSSSLKSVYAGPVIVGDGGSNKNRLESLRKRLGWPERGIDGYMKDQGIDSGTSRAKGFLSELGWRQGESQSYGEDEDD